MVLNISDSSLFAHSIQIQHVVSLLRYSVLFFYIERHLCYCLLVLLLAIFTAPGDTKTLQFQAKPSGEGDGNLQPGMTNLTSQLNFTDVCICGLCNKPVFYDYITVYVTFSPVFRNVCLV